MKIFSSKLKRIAIDPIFQPPKDFTKNKKTSFEIFSEIKFELIYDEAFENQYLKKYYGEDEENKCFIIK